MMRTDSTTPNLEPSPPEGGAGDANAALAKYREMIAAPVPGLLLKLGIPTTCSMLVTAIYNTAAAYYVSYLGTAAVGAMGVAFALQMMIQTLGIMVGQGCATLVSPLLGAKRRREADVVASSSLALAVVLGAIFAALSLLGLTPFLRLLGATPSILAPASEYSLLILFAAPFMTGAFALNNFLRAEGLAAVGTVWLAAGSILNLALSPLLIFTFEMGIRGAALSTALCQVFSFAMLLRHYRRGKGTLRLRFACVSKDWRAYADILKLGLPSLARNAWAAAAAAMLNLAAGQFGDAGVAAMSVVGRVMMIANAVMIGIGQGFQPILGYNWGAERYRRVVEALDDVLWIAFGAMSALGLLGFCFAPEILRFFDTKDPQVMEIGVLALKLQCVAAPLAPVSFIVNMAYQGVGRTKTATMLASMRQGIVFAPLIAALPPVWGVWGLAAAQPLSEVVSLLLCGWFFWKFRREANALIRSGKLPPADP